MFYVSIEVVKLWLSNCKSKLGKKMFMYIMAACVYSHSFALSPLQAKCLAKHLRTSVRFSHIKNVF